MSYYNECPNCGAHLDPGERCDCVPQPRRSRQYTLTKEDKAQLQAQAIDGIIPVQAHIGTMFKILNRKRPGCWNSRDAREAEAPTIL